MRLVGASPAGEKTFALVSDIPKNTLYDQDVMTEAGSGYRPRRLYDVCRCLSRLVRAEDLGLGMQVPPGRFVPHLQVRTTSSSGSFTCSRSAKSRV